MRFAEDFGPKIFENFCGHKILRSKSREIAPKSLPIERAMPLRDVDESSRGPASVGMLRHVRFRAIRSGFWTGKFRKFLQPPNFAFEITPKSLPVERVQPRRDVHGSQRGPASVGMLRHVRFCAICSGFRTEIFEKISRPQSFGSENACDRAEI